MNQTMQTLQDIRKKADTFRKKLQVYSMQKEFDTIVNMYENIIEELVYDKNC